MDPLKTLELQPGCSKEDVKRNFRRLSFLCHPDKHPDNKAAEDHFKDINNAYEFINKNPSILNKIAGTSSEGDLISTESTVTIEDIYLENNKKIMIKRQIPCKKCKGFGTTDIEHGLCSLCKGTGSINNKILGLMKLDNNCKCPACNGIGVNYTFICDECNGKKLEEEFVEYTFKLDIKSYHNKFALLHGKGNTYPHNHPGDVIVLLKVEPDLQYTLENDTLCLNYTVTPVQKLIEDTCEVSIFGKMFKFKINATFNEINLVDKRKEFSSPHKIKIRILVTRPVFTKEIRDLYKKIIALEKEATILSEFDPVF